MVYYGISESLIKRIVRFPERKELGIAENTVAVMSPYGKSAVGMRKSPAGRQPYRGEVWVMYQTIGSKKLEVRSEKTNLSFPKVRIISAWRYPGVSPVGKAIPIPDEILQELENLIE